MSIIRLSIAQLRSDLYDKQTNLYRIAQTLAVAKKEQKADYVLFPELYLTGYTLNDKVSDLAESVDGQSVRKIQEIAKKYNTGIIVGLPEKDKNKLYNSAIFIENDGELLGSYRKTHLFDFEKKWFSSGDMCPVFDTHFGKVGLMITYDMEFPEVARILARKGAQLILVLAANMVPYQVHQGIYLRSRAMENHVFVALTNKVGLENKHVFFGESEVIHPTGKILHRSLNNEDIATIEIDLGETKSSKGLLDYLSNRRLDLYQSEGLLTNSLDKGEDYY